MKLKKVLAVFHITYFQGWSAVCSYYISLGISVKNIRNTKSKIKAPLDYKNRFLIYTIFFVVLFQTEEFKAKNIKHSKEKNVMTMR